MAELERAAEIECVANGLKLSNSSETRKFYYAFRNTQTHPLLEISGQSEVKQPSITCGGIRQPSIEVAAYWCGTQQIPVEQR